jgi:hypothetical protein
VNEAYDAGHSLLDGPLLSRRSWPTFQKCLLPPSSGRWVSLEWRISDSSHTAYSSSWWWKQYALLKRLYTSTRSGTWRHITEGCHAHSYSPPWERKISLSLFRLFSRNGETLFSIMDGFICRPRYLKFQRKGHIISLTILSGQFPKKPIPEILKRLPMKTR